MTNDDDSDIRAELAKLKSFVAAHEAALKDLGPLMGLIMQVLMAEGLVEQRHATDKQGREVTVYRIKKQNFMLQLPGVPK